MSRQRGWCRCLRSKRVFDKRRTRPQRGIATPSPTAKTERTKHTVALRHQRQCLAHTASAVRATIQIKWGRQHHHRYRLVLKLTPRGTGWLWQGPQQPARSKNAVHLRKVCLATLQVSAETRLRKHRRQPPTSRLPHGTPQDVVGGVPDLTRQTRKEQ